jgi:hypothetical protein
MLSSDHLLSSGQQRQLCLTQTTCAAGTNGVHQRQRRLNRLPHPSVCQYLPLLLSPLTLQGSQFQRDRGKQHHRQRHLGTTQAPCLGAAGILYRRRDALSELSAAFEQSGLKQFAAELPERLTACAGVCFMKAGQPFRSGHELAESLCKRAKAHSRRAAHGGEIPSSIAWHKVQETLIDDAQALFERNHRIADGDRTLDCSLGVYGLHAGNGLPVLDDLLALLDSFSGGLNDRPLREVATLLRGSLTLASQAYLRWRELAEKQAAADLALFDQSLERLIGDVDQVLPFSCGEHRYSPIDDLLALRNIQGKKRETGEQDV